MSVNIKERLSEFWNSRNKWLLLCLIPVIAAIFFVVNLTRPEAESIRTLAELPKESEVTFNMEDNRAYTAEDGVIIIPASVQEAVETEDFQSNVSTTLSDPSQIWEDPSSLSTDSYTLPEDVTVADGSIGTLTIPKLELSAPVYEAEEGEELESMTKGIAHIAVTSAWEGNIGLASHNEAPTGAVAYFRDIHLLEQGDSISYKSSLGERQYRVEKVQEISDEDWSFLSPSAADGNKITLITCITGKPNSRLMVQASEENFVGVGE